MIRLVVVAVATVAYVVSFSLSPHLAAQQPGNQKTVPFPVQITGAAPGLNLELFVNAGKVADVPISPDGEGSWVLDLGNLGKTRIQVTVEQCEDGQQVQRVYFSGPGVTIPQDSKCKRRPVGAAWWSDCGVTRITLDVTRLGMRVVGCGSMWTEPKVYAPIGGALIVGGLVLAGGGGNGNGSSIFNSTVTSTPTNTTVSVAPPITTPTAPPSTTSPAPTTPPVTTPPPGTDFSVSVLPSWNHPGGPESFFCGLITTTPAQSGATYTLAPSGPGVISSQNLAGTLNSSGRAAFQIRINSYGSYTVVTNVAAGSVQRSATGSVNVTSASNTCPTP